MNIANTITISRIILIPFFVFFLLKNDFHSSLIACLIFVIASITDYIDGYLARKLSLVTNFGKIMDPLADKLLVLSGMISLVTCDKLSIWIVIIVLTRELGITSLRAVASEQGIIIAASNLGKVKTTIQMIAIILLIFNSDFTLFYGTCLIYIATALTVYSGIDYVSKFSKKITWF